MNSFKISNSSNLRGFMMGVFKSAHGLNKTRVIHAEAENLQLNKKIIDLCRELTVKTGYPTAVADDDKGNTHYYIMPPQHK